MLIHQNLKVKMKKLYRNVLDLSWTPDPIERRKNISKEIIQHADYLPKTLSYEDIDRCFKDWVDEKLNVIQDGVKLPTMVLYSNQRFSEYMQTWKYTDENNNVRLNFKTVTRENNPSHGTILNQTYNIPGDRFYNFKSINAVDDSGRKYRIDYKMRQPTPVDILYKVSIMTNRYSSINSFNEKIQKTFKAKQSYICPNGHYMSIVLENISDDSEYNIEDRQFFSQTFSVKVRGYILTEDDFIVEENPMAAIICFEGDTAKRRKPTIELSEYDPCYDNESKYFKKPIEINVDLSFCYPYKGKTKFTMDEYFVLTQFVLSEDSNIISDNVKLYINDVLISEDLLNDAYEGYKKCNTIPQDANEENTTTYEEMPIELDRFYKYIIFDGSYYKWNQIIFNDGDEITVQVKKYNRFNNLGNFKLLGYNKYIVVTSDESYNSCDGKNERNNNC